MLPKNLSEQANNNKVVCTVFEINKTYANRNGKYTVLAINGPKMLVRYEDGKEANLRMNMQERIWENILAEQEAAAAKQKKKVSRHGPKVSFYIKTLSISEEADLAIPGLKKRQCIAQLDANFQIGDRLVYYAVESKKFFAVATITAEPKKGKARDYLFGENMDGKVHLYPIDVDAHVVTEALAVSIEKVEMESVANPLELLIEADKYHALNEDDFELVAEMVMERDAEAEDMDDDVEEELEPEDIADSILGAEG